MPRTPARAPRRCWSSAAAQTPDKLQARPWTCSCLQLFVPQTVVLLRAKLPITAELAAVMTPSSVSHAFPAEQVWQNHTDLDLAFSHLSTLTMFTSLLYLEQFKHNVQANIDEVYGCLRKSKLPFGPHKGELKPLEHYAFRDDPKEAKVFWDVRKGLIPIVGGARESGALAAPSLVLNVYFALVHTPCTTFSLSSCSKLLL